MLNHVRRGSGEPLVLIHPLGGELVVWEPLIDVLARERDVIAVDLPGFGGSDPLSNGARPTPQLLAGSVAGFLDRLGIERAHVADNSLGGLRSSVGHPERVPPAAAFRLVRSYVTSPGFEGANAAMRAAVFSGVDQIRVPVTLAWAELDRLVRRPRETTPGWRTLVLQDCGHIPTWDDPEQVARVLLQASG